MSKSTELLEAAVAEVIANRPAEGERQTARQRIMADRAFATVLRIIAPRIRHFIKQYGLTAHWEDAEQVCAIGVHRAIEAYDPAKAMFTTFVNWQLRGELQGLRFRLMDDQRPSAKKVEATTISLHAMERGADGEDMPLESMIEDEYAEERTEAAAADHLAEQTCAALMDEYVRHLRSVGIAQLKRKAATTKPLATRRERSTALPVYVQSRAAKLDPEELRKLDERIARDCDIVRRHLFGQGESGSEEQELGLTRERIRQITRRAARLMSELAAGNSRFAMESEQEAPTMLPRASHELGHSAPVRVTEPELEALDSLPVPTLAFASAARH